MKEVAHRSIALCAVILCCGLQLDAQKRSSVLLYYADAYADHYGVSRALVHAIISQESNWNPWATSNKGAAGIMQLMPETALQYGVHDRYALTENLNGGVQYLADLLNQFHGDMRLAVAAYYCGARHLEQSGLSYRNPDVIAYVEVIRNRYRRELRQVERQNVALGAGGQ